MSNLGNLKCSEKVNSFSKRASKDLQNQVLVNPFSVLKK